MAGPYGPDVRWFCCVVFFVINNNRPPGLPPHTGLPTIRYRRGDGRGALMIPQAMGLTGTPPSTPLPLSPHPGLMGRRGFRVGVMNDRDGWLGTKHVLTSSEYGATLQKGQRQGERGKGKKWASRDFQSFLYRLFENVCVCVCLCLRVFVCLFVDESGTEAVVCPLTWSTLTLILRLTLYLLHLRSWEAQRCMCKKIMVILK